MSNLNNFRTVALTPVPIKTFEGFVLIFVKSLLPFVFDPFQLAYRSDRSVEDAIYIWLHEVLFHLEHVLMPVFFLLILVRLLIPSSQLIYILSFSIILNFL